MFLIGGHWLEAAQFSNEKIYAVTKHATMHPSNRIDSVTWISFRVQKNRFLFKKAQPTGFFFGFFGFYWVSGFYWVFVGQAGKNR